MHLRTHLPSLIILLIGTIAFGAADTPNPGLKYYYPAPEAPVVDVEADIIVYGGTSGGVAAAVQAARQGNSVALVVFGRHVGGLTSGGLTATDGVNASVQGGLTREYFNLTGNAGFKPSKAEAAFESLLADPLPDANWDSPIPTYYEQRLAEVEKDGERILALRMENGSVFRGRMFIDCTYEGDVMAMAGVPYTYGREANTEYGESLAGRESSVSLPGVDPYIIEGDASSGLIRNVMPDEVEGPTGSADDHIQAYNFRMFTVQNSDPSKYQPLWQPPTYNPEDFEILYRYHRAGGSTSMQVGNDINNHEMFNRGVSTDHIGGNRWTDDGVNFIPWADANYDIREQIYQSHVAWQLGMLWYVQNDPDYAALATDPDVPAATRTSIANLITKVNQLGLPLGEYPETGGWTHELYVREARRMVSDFVVTQHYYDRQLPVIDSVGMANYRADAHHSRRFVSEGGSLRIEGDTGGNTTIPWQIPYRSLVPPADSATNLYVPWCLSASHVAFCSIRMEPCFMVLAQSSAIAAGLAIEEQETVQNLDYETLRPLLLAAGQILGDRPASNPPLTIDNTDSEQLEISGEWLTSNSTQGYFGTNYLHDSNEAVEKSVTYRPEITEAGEYLVTLRWTSHSNRATNASVTVNHANGSESMTINQQANGGTWYPLGQWDFDVGTEGSVTLSTAGADGYVIADAAQFTMVADLPPPLISVIASNPLAREDNAQPARIQFVRDNFVDTSAIELTLMVDGDAVAGEDYIALPSTVTIPAGALSTELWITPIANDNPDGTRSLTIGVAPVPGYEFGSGQQATIKILDKPADQWRYENFAPTGEESSSLSEPNADPDGDARTNLLERFFGTDPNRGNINALTEPHLAWVMADGRVYLGLSWHRASDARDFNYQVLYSESLANDSWTPLVTQTETTHWSPDSGDRDMRQLLDVTDLGPVFFKMTVTDGEDI